jgi:hypothetical protein
MHCYGLPCPPLCTASIRLPIRPTHCSIHSPSHCPQSLSTVHPTLFAAHSTATFTAMHYPTLSTALFPRVGASTIPIPCLSLVSRCISASSLPYSAYSLPIYCLSTAYAQQVQWIRGETGDFLAFSLGCGPRTVDWTCTAHPLLVSFPSAAASLPIRSSLE